MAARATAFGRVQEELGVEFIEWEGWLWPSGFGDVEGEYRAVRSAVGIVDGSPLGNTSSRDPTPDGPRIAS